MTARVTDDFLADVVDELGFQATRWSLEHDDGKSDADWFWLIGRIVGKVLEPGASVEKRRHRLRAAAAVLVQWDRRLVEATE